MKKIPSKTRPFSLLILSCSGGAGHIRAAEALHRTAPGIGFPLQTEHHDVLEFTTQFFRRAYGGSYLAMVNHIPEVWGYLYNKSEDGPYKKQGIVRIFDRLMYRRYVDTIVRMRPDALVCTHFLPYISIADRLEKMQIPVFAVTTDFDIHQLWVNPVVTRYSVFHEESAWQLQAKGVPADRIAVHGIPVQPEFSRPVSQESARAAAGLPRNTFTILILSGGFGVGNIEGIVRQVLGTVEKFHDRRFSVCVVCGRNAEARTAVEALPTSPNVSMKVLGFVDTIHTLMGAADVLVSKSGGLTSSEALARGLPMIVIDPIPGQESRNADLMVEHGAAWKAINLPNLSYKLNALLQRPALLKAARKQAQVLGRPRAASGILKDVVEQLKRGTEQ